MTAPDVVARLRERLASNDTAWRQSDGRITDAEVYSFLRAITIDALAELERLMQAAAVERPSSPDDAPAAGRAEAQGDLSQCTDGTTQTDRSANVRSSGGHDVERERFEAWWHGPTTVLAEAFEGEKETAWQAWQAARGVAGTQTGGEKG